MNVQSSSGNYSMRHRVYLSAAVCISRGTTFGRMLAQEYLECQSCKRRVLKIVKIDK